MVYIHSEIVIKLKRGVLWLRKQEVSIGFIGKRETRQCIINNNEFHNHCSTWLHFLFYATQLVFIYSFFSSSSITHPPSCVFFFFCLLHDCWHLHSSVFVWKKDKRFFSLPVVLSLTHFSPHPVSCVFSPISGILRSPPSMWVTLMCAAGLYCKAGSSPICNLGVLCVLVDYEFCVCVFISVCAMTVIRCLYQFSWMIITLSKHR